MLLKISSPENVIYDSEIKKVTIPTESGDITVLPGHMPLVSVVKPWLVTIWPTEQDFTKNEKFIFSDEKITVSISKWMVYIDWKNISVVTSIATSNPEWDENTLTSMKQELEEKIIELKKQWSIEEIERSLIKLEKIRADIQLVKLKNK